MIQYALKCASGHGFESWFQSAAAFDRLHAAGHVACAVCGSTEVAKDLMAPRVSQGERKATEAKRRPLTERKSDEEKALAAFRKHLEKNAHYVGGDFAREARAMHAGEAPDRSIWGEAKPEDAKRLIEDGVPVAPLPFAPTRKTN